MADYQQKELSGSIFRNDKRTNSSQPNARGSCLIDGVEYRISAWTKDTRNGDKFQSLAFTRKEENFAGAAKAKEAPPAEDYDDDCPF